MQIQKLLNPSQGGRHESRGHSTSPAPHNYPTTLATPTIPPRQKMVKDAPIFSEGNRLAGHVNYWPHEADGDRALASQHRRFHVYPLGQICSKGVRHIPYNSDRKTFSNTTGRNAFEMFQYTYRVPGEDKEYVVVWDYNIGLVRMTPFFKACKYSKTTPAKALRDNPGMKEISYSITGGALVCQGYWMPYQAARAIASTFCYRIRFALTPVFGNDFPATCLHPEDPSFGRFNIDPAIVRFCEEETRRFKVQGEKYRIDCPMTSGSVSSNQQEELETDATCEGDHQLPSPKSYTEADEMRWLELGLHATRTPSPKPKPDTKTLRWLKGAYEAGDDHSEYSSDAYSNGKGIFSAQVSPRTQNTWVSINGSVMNSPAPQSIMYPDSPFTSRMPNPFSPTSVPAEFAVRSSRTKRSHSKVSGSEYGEPTVSPRTHRGHLFVEEDDDDMIMLDSGTGPSEADIEAAHALVSLSRGG